MERMAVQGFVKKTHTTHTETPSVKPKPKPKPKQTPMGKQPKATPMGDDASAMRGGSPQPLRNGDFLIRRCEYDDEDRMLCLTTCTDEIHQVADIGRNYTYFSTFWRSHSTEKWNCEVDADGVITRAFWGGHKTCEMVLIQESDWDAFFGIGEHDCDCQVCPVCTACIAWGL